jgi:AcrR family transcriptional regulator
VPNTRPGSFDPAGVVTPAAGTPVSGVAGPTVKMVQTLETVNRLFYSEGIRAVGVDRLISESGVTKATFYKHFQSRDNVVQL